MGNREPAAPEHAPRELSKPLRIYADVYGDPASAGHHPISGIMTRDVVCVSPGLPLPALAALFAERALRVVPVVDGDHRLIGLATESDLLRCRDGETVADIMTRKVLALPEWTPVAKAAALMAFEGEHCIPVLSTDRRVVGMLSGLDVLRWLAEREGYLLPPRPR
jgi:CBS-domain-containing membrane protein